MSRVPPEALEIHAILERYVAIDKAIFKFSMRRILPIPGLFEAIDYRRHERELAELLRPLLAIIDAHEEKGLSTGLLEYALALSNAISSLMGICLNLYRKSQDADHYDHATYRSDLETYHSWVDRYRALGMRLNRELA